MILHYISDLHQMDGFSISGWSAESVRQNSCSKFDEFDYFLYYYNYILAKPNQTVNFQVTAFHYTKLRRS